MRTITIVMAALALTGCGKDPISVSSSDNPQIPVEHILTVDGCKVYRFEDYGRMLYLTTCSGSVKWQERCGKSCSHPVNVQTVDSAENAEQQ